MVINLFEIYSTNTLSSSFVDFKKELTKWSFKLFKYMLNSQYYLIVDTQISRKTSNVGKQYLWLHFLGTIMCFHPMNKRWNINNHLKNAWMHFFRINHGENHKELLKKTTWKGRELIATSVGQLLIFFHNCKIGFFFLKNKNWWQLGYQYRYQNNLDANYIINIWW